MKSSEEQIEQTIQDVKDGKVRPWKKKEAIEEIKIDKIDFTGGKKLL